MLGSKGEIADGWNYDAYVQYGASIYAEHYLNDVSIAKLQNALNTTVGTGVCANLRGRRQMRADQHLRHRPDGGPKAALAYVSTPGFKEGDTTEQIVEADVNGDLGQYGLKSPLAKEGVKIALGTDYRREALEENVDAEFSTGDLQGQGGSTPSTAGSFNVYEVYTELNVPLISDMQFVKSLNFDGGYRYSEYDDVGQTETYKLELQYAPIDDVKFRASFNHAVRAPNVDELFAPTTVGLFSGTDPCANSATGAPPPASRAAGCAP